MKKIKLLLTSDEWLLVINGLNALRTGLIEEGYCTDFVDELMVKVVDAPTEWVKAS